MKHDPLLGYIYWRIDNNKNAIIIINGATGSGKTYAGIHLALNIAEHYGIDFDIHKHMAFSFEEIHDRMSHGRNRIGQPYLMEEVGAVGSGTSSNEWQSRANKLFNSFLQTARHRRQALILTCPVFTMLEASSRRLCHIMATMERIDFTTNTSYMKPYIIQTNARTGDQYFKLFRYRYEGIQTKMRLYGVPLIPKTVITAYEHEKNQYSKRLDHLIRTENRMIHEKERYKNHIHHARLVTPTQILHLKDQGFTIPEIAKKFASSIKTIEAKLRVARASSIN